MKLPLQWRNYFFILDNEKLMQEYIGSGGPLGIFKYKWVARSWTEEILKSLHIENALETDNWLNEIIYNLPALNLVYTLREFQPYEEEFESKKYLFLGASVYDRREQAWQYKKQGRPLIYISLGTVVKGKRTFFQSCVDAFRDEDVEVILSTGFQFDKGKLKNIPENVYIYPSVPQTQVLKQADVFVTHGGMNSVSEAFTHGVSLVVVPFMSDQPVNARRVEELGLGVQLDYHIMDKEVLRRTVLSVLENAHIKEKAIKIQEQIYNAPGNVGGAEAIVSYVRGTFK